MDGVVGEGIDFIDSVEKPFRDSGIWEKISPDVSESKNSANSQRYEYLCPSVFLEPARV